MKLEQMLNSNGTSDLATYDAQINALQADVNNYQARYNSNMTASNNWSKPAWEDAMSKWRKGKLEVFQRDCVRTSRNSSPCISDNQTGRKDRYQKRLGEARSYYHKAQDALSAKNSSQALLNDAKAKKANFEKALAEGAAKGLDGSQVSALYQAELDKLKAEQDAINAQAAAAEKSAASSANTKYYIIGGVALLIIAGFFIMRRKK